MQSADDVSVEIIPNRLYWLSDRAPPKNRANSYYFNIDNELVYEPFCTDFGPLNLGMMHKFCVELEKLMKSPNYLTYTIFHYTTLNPHKRANAAFLMGAYQVVVMGRTAVDAWKPFTYVSTFTPFRDASFGGSNFQLPILNCLRGLEKAIELGWYDYRTFNVQEYEYYERVENGDFNWILPKKLLAFSCPSPTPTDAEGWRTFTPEDYSQLFKKIGTTAVVRLNKVTYEADRFTRLGIRHYELYFLDGSCPTEELVKQFIEIVENESGSVAVHCKAGLGRTGTMIGCYVMKHYDFPALDFIGWIRICRPGSVLGPQQFFLVNMEAKCRSWRSEFKVKTPTRSRTPHADAVEEPKSEILMSPDEKAIAIFGDRGQASRLVNAKKTNQFSPGSNQGSPSPASRAQASSIRASSLGPVSKPKVSYNSPIFRNTKGVSRSPPSALQNNRRLFS